MSKFFEFKVTYGGKSEQETVRHYWQLILKSVAASLLIGLGNFVLLKLSGTDYSFLGPILFSFGLLGVCMLGLNLFTGKCGFLFADKIKPADLITILLANLISGWIFGWLFSIADPSIIQVASEKVATWETSFSFLLKSILCGVIMYLAVYIYREKKSPLGILFGIPLFIFCGFQHCIANIITLGIAGTFDWSILFAVIGNFIGSLAIWYLAKSNS